MLYFLFVPVSVFKHINSRMHYVSGKCAGGEVLVTRCIVLENTQNTVETERERQRERGETDSELIHVCI